MSRELNADIEKLSNPKSVRFRDLLGICERYFGRPRIRGSHHIFKMPWKGDPRINLQGSGKTAMSNRYTYRVEWSDDDEVYVGRCIEFPSLGAHGTTPTEALAGIESVVSESVQWMLEDGETPPQPLGSAAFKGRILFRTSPETHRELSIRAQEDGVSLNQYLQSLVQRHLAAAMVEDEVHELSRAVYRIERRLEGSGTESVNGD